MHPFVVANSLSWPREEWLEIDGSFVHVRVPAMGQAVVDASHSSSFGSPSARSNALENDLVRVEFAGDGSIFRITDKEEERELLLPGERGNVFALYEDWGDAWDFPMGYRDLEPHRLKLEHATTLAGGPFGRVVQTWRTGDTVLTQIVRLTQGSKRIDFVTKVDWRESNTMLRVSFPIDVRTSRATCEIQFGSLERPTHRNTSWDLARDEICAQRWLDLSEETYGVALLNDCKYGHRVEGTTLDLDLLRSPGHPDPVADRAEHEFTYSLFPHRGNHAVGGVVREAAALNTPLRVVALPDDVEGVGLAPSFITIDNPGIVIDTVKKAEDSGALIVRLYEAHGATARATLRLHDEFATAALVDLMEGSPVALAHSGGRIPLTLRPFEIVTVRIGR